MRCLETPHTKLASCITLARRWPVSWALPICSARLPRLRSINGDLAKARFALRTGSRSIASTRIFHASMTVHGAARHPPAADADLPPDHGEPSFDRGLQ